LKSGNFVQTSKIHGFVNLCAQILFFGTKIQDFSSEICWLLGDLASGLDFEPKDPRFNPQTAKKANKNCTVLPGNQKSAKMFYEIKNKTPMHRCANLNFGRIQWIEVRRCKFRPKLTNGERKLAEKNELRAKI
jgi:hypothetical protein